MSVRPSVRPSELLEIVREVARVTARRGSAAVLAVARADSDDSGVAASSASSGVSAEAVLQGFHDMRI